jgi:NAD(P)-dependent dehydrogenase (short-subunit alcohol dehydrogenase family)
VFLIWLFLSGPAPMSVAQTAPPSERDRGSTGWNVEQLLEHLAKNRHAEVRFGETAFSDLLPQPLKTQGILRFTPPAGLEKHITAPHDKRYLVEGDTLLIESKTKGTNRTLSLHDYPALRGLIEAFRSTHTNYAAAKAGLHGASKSLAREVASRGVTVNVVAPGFIESRMMEQSCKPDKIEALVPMKRASTLREVTYLVGFLASETADYICGQVIGLKGGMA